MNLLWDQKCPNLLESPKKSSDSVEKDSKEIHENHQLRTETLETDTKSLVRRNSRKLEEIL